MKSCSKWEKNLVARQQRRHQDKFFLSRQMNTITASPAEHCSDDSVSYDSSSQPQLLMPNYLLLFYFYFNFYFQFLLQLSISFPWMNKKRDEFIFDDYVEKNKNASDSTDSFILLKTLHTLHHRVYFGQTSSWGSGLVCSVWPSSLSSIMHISKV